MTRNGLDEEREALFTSQEAKEAFLKAGLSEATFHRRVQSGEIHSILPEGRKRGAYYPKSDVIASIHKTGRTQKKVKVTQLVKTAECSKATTQEMPEVGALLGTFFSKINIEKRKAWIERNPDICSILRSEGKIVGCAFLLPLPEEKIMHILNAQIKTPTRPGDILLYEPGNHYSLYLRSVVVLQSVSKLQKRYWAAKLIGELIREIESMGRKGLLIEKIYAQTDTRHVEHLLKVMGFTQIISPTAASNFVLDIATSGSLYARKLRRAMNTWLEE